MYQLAEEFVLKKMLPPSFKAELVVDRFGSPALSIEHPVALARFVSFAKSRVSKDGSDVLLRGQDQDHPGMTPSLFRCDVARRERRVKAYVDLVKEAPDVLGYLRFRRNNMGAVLQHYGIRTPWLDLIDNIYTAIWFALHTRFGCGLQRPYYARSRFDHGWLYLIATRDHPGSGLYCIDLRKHHSSMNVRLHAQHGFAASSQQDIDEIVSFDYHDHIVARVRIPNKRQFAVEGPLATPQFLFPGPDIDESLKLLQESKLHELLANLESKHGLPEGDLGRIEHYRFRRPRGAAF